LIRCGGGGSNAGQTRVKRGTNTGQSWVNPASERDRCSFWCGAPLQVWPGLPRVPCARRRWSIADHRSARPNGAAAPVPARLPLQERPDAILPTMGGQTGLNLAKNLAEVRARWGL
jgi:hypothetical protein